VNSLGSETTVSVKGRSSVKRLIVNADGFGFGPGATRAIFEAVAAGGPITSVSVNANFPDAERLGEFVGRFPHISVGVHINPIVGRPCLPRDKVPSLLNENGSFLGRGFARAWRTGLIAPAVLELELGEQIHRVKEIARRNFTHIDSHQNSHLSYFRLFVRLARHWNIPFIRTNASLIGLEARHPWKARARTYVLRPYVLAAHVYRCAQMRWAKREGLRMADRLVTVGYAGVGNKSQVGNWERILQNLPAGTYEIYCHPAHPDDVLRSWASYVEPRLQELEILRNAHLRDVAVSEGVRLVSFLQLLEA
jgi:predicted glycoside hydrolase/deacetylase ChbG (UPF0249 family)